MLREALQYLDKGFSVIPVGGNKKPLISWKQYQDERPDRDTLRQWWSTYPDANIGIVTGKISGLAVVDIDTDEGYKAIEEYIPCSIQTPKVLTPSGGQHWYFRFKEGLTNNARTIPGCDLRAEGGYVIAPPSRSPKGEYRFDRTFDVKLQDLPEKYIKYVIDASNKYNTKDMPTGDLFTQGRRDEDLFHVANYLAKSGLEEEYIRETLNALAKKCGFSPKEAQIKVDSALSRMDRQSRQWTQEVEDWVLSQVGHWSVTNCYGELQAVTKQNKSAVRSAIARIMERGIIERHGDRAGTYRRINKEEVIIDWKNAPTKELDFWLPFELNDLVRIYPKNIVVVAGTNNAGKALRNGTPVLAVDGWKNIEDLVVGDSIFNKSGDIEKVLGVFPQEQQHDCYRFTFNDGSWIDSDENHIWTAQTEYQRRCEKTGRGNKNESYGKWINLTTKEIVKKYGLGRLTAWQAVILPQNDVVKFPSKEVPIDPYILGLLLGDGSLSKKTPDISTADGEVLQAFKDEGYNLSHIGGYDYSIKTQAYNVERKSYVRKNGVEVSECIVSKDLPPKILRLNVDIKKLGLHGKKAHEKFVPNLYLHNDAETRLAILKGLMDTDGTVDNTGRTIEFCSSSKKLANDVQFLVRSLGGRAALKKSGATYTYMGEKKNGLPRYRVTIKIDKVIFNLKRKKERQQKYKFKRTSEKILKTIEYVGMYNTTCITTSSPDNLFIAKDFIVTHNTVMLLNMVKENMHKHDITYFSSEMGGGELKSRLTNFGDVDIDDWNFTPIERSGEFADVIRPDGVNIIDFMEIHEEHYKVGKWLKQIFDKLNNGIAIIAIQKKYDTDVGVGGHASLEKPRLYLTVDSGRILIKKAKSWRGNQCPNNAYREFKVENGSRLLPTTEWMKDGMPLIKKKEWMDD